MDKKSIKNLIAQGNLSKALDSILNLSARQDDDDLHTQALMLSARLNGLTKESRMGIISGDAATLSRNQITRSLLYLVNQLEDEPAENDAPDLRFHVSPTRDQRPKDAGSRGKKLFISYAREDRLYVENLEKHLYPLIRKGLLSSWTDSDIQPGQAWSNVIEGELKDADIIVMVVSSDFLSSRYIQENEIKWSKERYNTDGVIIVPIIARPCYWEQEFFAQFNAYPKDPQSGQLTPIAKWTDQDNAYLEIVRALTQVLEAD